MLAALVGAALAAPVEIATTVENHAWCFGSGLRVLFEEDHARPEVSIHTVIDGGSGGEAAGTQGVAHLLEHLWFVARPSEGTQVQSELARMGARFNAYTDQDATVFVTRGPAGSLGPLLALEVARLEGTLAGVDAGSFDVERNIVRNELRQRFSDTSASAWEPIYQGLFPVGHPYHALPIGTEPSLAALTLAQAAGYAERWYQPEHTTLAVTGPLDAEVFGSELARAFPASLLADASGEMNGMCAARAARLPLPAPVRTEATVWEAAVERPLAVAAWVVPPDSAWLASFDLYIIERMMAFELDRAVSCGIEERFHAAVGQCAFDLEPGEDGEKLARRGLAHAALAWEPNERQAVADLYARWQEVQRSALFQTLERAGGRRAAMHFHVTGEQGWIDARLRQTRVDDFSEAARFGLTTLHPKRAKLVVVRPSADDPATLATFHGSRAYDAAQAVDPGSVDAAFLAGILSEPDWGRARSVLLPNGVTVTVLPFGKLGITRASLLFPGGEASPLIDAMAWSTLPTVDAAGWALAFDVLGRWEELRRGSDWRYTLSGGAFEAQLAGLVAHHATQVPSGETARTLRRQARPVSTPHGEAEVARRERLLPGSPQRPEQIQAALAGFTNEALRSYTQDKLRADGAHVVVVGPVDPEAVVTAARASVGALKSTGVPRTSPPKPPMGPLPDAVVLAFDDPVDRSQASVVLECRLDANALTASVAADAIGALLHDALRGAAGLTYGVDATTVEDDRGLRLRVSTQVQRDALARAVTAMRDGVRTVAAGDLDARRLAAAKVETAVSLADALQQPDQVLDWLSSRVLRGASASDTVAANLAAVDAAAVRTALQSCASHEVVTAVGTGAKDQLVAAGLTSD